MLLVEWLKEPPSWEGSLDSLTYNYGFSLSHESGFTIQWYKRKEKRERDVWMRNSQMSQDDNFDDDNSHVEPREKTSLFIIKF